MWLFCWWRRYKSHGMDGAHMKHMEMKLHMGRSWILRKIRWLRICMLQKNTGIMFCECIKWCQDGIIEKDPAGYYHGNEYQYTQRLFCGAGNYSPIQMNENQHIAAENGFEYGYMTMVEAQVTNSSVAESMWGIARNSERPDKAMEFCESFCTVMQRLPIL